MIIDKRKIAGTVVLYNPNLNVLENVVTYINQVSKLYLIDNSERPHNLDKSVLNYGNVQFVENRANYGIAKALNQAAELALNDGYDFLLTMDQDSRISEDFMEKMFIELEKDSRIGIISPFVIQNANPQNPKDPGLLEIEVSMTSGSIIRLSAHKEISGYLEKLFIDYVDHEYCLRMKSFGYKIKQLNSAKLYHNLGDIVTKTFIFRKVFPTNHLPIRWYFRTRNRFYVYSKFRKQFAEYVKRDRIEFVKELLKIFLYEEQKLKKFKMIFKGYLDYRRNNYGNIKMLNNN